MIKRVLLSVLISISRHVCKETVIFPKLFQRILKPEWHPELCKHFEELPSKQMSIFQSGFFEPLSSIIRGFPSPECLLSSASTLRANVIYMFNKGLSSHPIQLFEPLSFGLHPEL